MSYTFVDRIVAIIPAKGHSERLPEKNLTDLCGKPLIVHTVEQALASSHIDSVYVVTDNRKIGDVCSDLCNVIYYDAAETLDSTTSDGAVRYALARIGLSGDLPATTVFLQCTSPIREPNSIDDAIKLFMSSGADSLLSLSPVSPFIWSSVGNRVECLTYDVKSRKKSQDMSVFVENGSIFIMKTLSFLTEGNRICGKNVKYIMPKVCAIDIDDAEDMEIARAIMEHRGRNV